MHVCLTLIVDFLEFCPSNSQRKKRLLAHVDDSKVGNGRHVEINVRDLTYKPWAGA